MRRQRNIWETLLRSMRMLKHKMVREPLPPEKVAGGWALGMFIGCAIPFGMQLIISIPLAVVMKVSKVGASVGTFITNPFSIIFIYPAQTWIGGWLIGRPLGWSYLMEQCRTLATVNLFSADGWHLLARFSGELLCGFFIGGLLNAIILTPVTYFIVKSIVTRRRARIQAKFSLPR